MKKIEITVYTIDELKETNKNAYNKVIDDAKEKIINNRFDFASFDISIILKEKYNLSVDEKNIYYSISYCQGDGMCFTMDHILSYIHIKNNMLLNVFEKWITNNLNDDEKMLLLEYLNCNYNLSIKKKSHHYEHAYTCFIDYEYFYSSDDPKFLDRMNNFISDLCDKLFNNVYVVVCGEIEKILYNYYDVDDDECIDNINDNGYMFDIDGDIY